MGAKKREILATVRSSDGKTHHNITRKPNGQLDCSCMSQRYRTFKQGETCCKHLKQIRADLSA